MEDIIDMGAHSNNAFTSRFFPDALLGILPSIGGRPCVALENLLDRTTRETGESARSTLSRFEVGAMQLLRASAPPAVPSDPAVRIEFGVKYYGRVFIRAARPAESPDIEVLFGTFLVSAADYLKLERASALQRQRAGARARALLAQLPTSVVARDIERLAYVFRHSAPTTYLVDERAYTSFYPRPVVHAGESDEVVLIDALERCQSLPLAEWDDYVAELILCLVCLLRSGPPTRMEELNSTLVTVPAIRRFLLKKARQLGVDRSALSGGNILQLADLVGAHRARVGSDQLIYRSINGVSLRKREIIRQKGHRKQPGMPEAVRSYLCDSLGSLDQGVSTAIERELTRRLSERGSHSEAGIAHYIDEMIRDVVDLAVDDIHSDFAMSRGLRLLSAFVRADLSDDYATMCGWPQPAYYCYVSSRRDLPNDVEAEQLGRIKNAIAARMRYNSWNYLPGNLPSSLVPDDRVFYLPPVLSDVTVGSDRHHPGHVNVGVKFAIRSPASIATDRRCYRAFTDLRLMRQSGAPYTEANLIQADRYSSVLADIIEGSVAFLARNPELDCELRIGMKSAPKMSANTHA